MKYVNRDAQSVHPCLTFLWISMLQAYYVYNDCIALITPIHTFKVSIALI